MGHSAIFLLVPFVIAFGGGAVMALLYAHGEREQTADANTAALNDEADTDE